MKLVDLEELSDDELKNLEQQFTRIRKKAETTEKKVTKLESAVRR